nr:hypothetical protein 2 [ssRNA positive-strand virus sp.]
MKYNTLIVFLLGVSSASILKLEFLRRLDDTGNSEMLFYHGLNFTFGKQFQVAYSAFKYDPMCVSVHRTNSLLYVGCQLPRHCGSPMVHVFDQGLFGQETVLCYSFHDKYQSNLRYTEFDISHFNIDLTKPFSRTELKYINAVRPVTLDRNFYLLFNSSDVALLPRICTMFYPSRIDSIASYISIEGDRDEVCVEIPSISRMECTPRWFANLELLMMHYNYPVSYAGAPNDGDDTLDTNLKGAVALYELLRSTDNYTLVSHRDGRYYASYYPLDKTIAVIPLRFPPSYENKLCMRVQSAYLNPVSSIFHYLMSQLEYIFSEILDALSESVEELLLFLIKVTVKVVDVVLDLIPNPDYFLTSCFIFVITYFVLSKLYQSVLISFVAYFLQIYINNSIKI